MGTRHIKEQVRVCIQLEEYTEENTEEKYSHNTGKKRKRQKGCVSLSLSFHLLSNWRPIWAWVSSGYPLSNAITASSLITSYWMTEHLTNTSNKINQPITLNAGIWPECFRSVETIEQQTFHLTRAIWWFESFFFCGQGKVCDNRLSAKWYSCWAISTVLCRLFANKRLIFHLQHHWSMPVQIDTNIHRWLNTHACAHARVCSSYCCRFKETDKKMDILLTRKPLWFLILTI